MMEELLKRAAELAGREVEVEKVKDGKYIVLFLSLTSPPPPKGETPEKALENFITWMEGMPKRELPELEVGSDDSGDTAEEPREDSF